ncbi:MAG: YihY/virulence factor BrkB family protein [Symploca sp. SIO2E9]|nr:YihY/virulence factor BrkB family protein [Symploca sp. SIO2E9]
MPVTRIVLLVLVMGGLAVFTFSNWSSIVPLVFWGMKTPPLPLAVWIGGAISLGVITSFCLQFLSYLPKGYSTRSHRVVGAVPPRHGSFRREKPQSDSYKRDIPYNSPPPQQPAGSRFSDWEESVSKDWEFEEPAQIPSSQQPDINSDYSGETRFSTSTSYEVKQEPKTSSQNGSVYSYSYRDTEKSGVGKADDIYDANYRVITPPYKPVAQTSDNAQTSNNEDDWGFEDDEEFNEEVERVRKQ